MSTGLSFRHNGTDDFLEWDGVITANRFKGSTSPYLVIAASNSSDLAKEKADYICDGTADQEEIQEAIDSLSQGKILLCAGTFNISSSIELKHQITLAGENMGGTSLSLATGAACNIINLSPTGTEFFATIQDLKIVGKTSAASGHGIYTSADNGGFPSDVQINNVYVSRCKQDGFHIGKAWGYKITDCLSEFNKGYGFYFAASSQCIIKGCFIAYNEGAAGIYTASNTTDLQFIGNHIYRNYNTGMDINGDLTIISGNIFNGNGENTASDHVNLSSGASGCAVISNVFYQGLSGAILEDIDNNGTNNIINPNVGITGTSGTFTASGSVIVTVTNGIITSIA